MSTTDAIGWHRTSPLAAIFYLGKIYQAIAQNAVQTLLPLAVFVFAFEGNTTAKIVLGSSAFVLSTIIISIIRYWFFRYQITGDSILIREGVIKKTELDIKFDRIQAISTRQNVVYRIFDLVTIKLDTAGSAGQEGNLPAVGSALATVLRERIRSNRVPAKRDIGESEDAGDDSCRVRTLLSLGNADIVRIGLSDNRALIFLAFLGPLIERFDRMIERGIVDGTDIAALVGVRMSVTAGSLLALGFLLLLAAASVIGAFLRFHEFGLVLDRDMLRSTGGLITRHEHSIKPAKIQTVVATQGVMLRLFGRFRLKARQASSGHGGKRKSFIVPLCEPEQLGPLCRGFLGDEFPGLMVSPANAAFRPIATLFIRTRFVLTGVIPACLAMLALSPSLGWQSLAVLLWMPMNALIVWQVYRRYGVLVTEDGLALRSGFVGYRVIAFLHRKVQRVSVTQTPFQRRNGLATMRFYLASGSIRIPYVDIVKARALRDYVLFRVESSELAWH